MNLRNIGSAAVLSLAALVGAEGCGKPEAEIPKTGSVDIDAEFSQDQFSLKSSDSIFQPTKPAYLDVPQTTDEFREMLLLCLASADGVNAFIGRSSVSKTPQGCRSAQVIAELKQRTLDICFAATETKIPHPEIQEVQKKMAENVKTFQMDLYRFKNAYPECFPDEPVPILSSVDAL